MKTRTVLSMNIASKLVRKGHPIIQRRPNVDNLKWDVFIFERTPEFDKDFKELMKKGKSK